MKGLTFLWGLLALLGIIFIAKNAGLFSVAADNFVGTVPYSSHIEFTGIVSECGGIRQYNQYMTVTGIPSGASWTSTAYYNGYRNYAGATSLTNNPSELTGSVLLLGNGFSGGVVDGTSCSTRWVVDFTEAAVTAPVTTTTTTTTMPKPVILAPEPVQSSSQACQPLITRCNDDSTGVHICTVDGSRWLPGYDCKYGCSSEINDCRVCALGYHEEPGYGCVKDLTEQPKEGIPLEQVIIIIMLVAVIAGVLLTRK